MNSKYRRNELIMLIIVGIALLCLALVAFAVNTHSLSSQEVVHPATRDELLKLVNQERAKYGISPLVDDPRLDQSAQRKADDMVKYDYNAHISPHDGKHGYEYINDVGISCKTDGENLYWGNSAQYPSSSSGAVTWWMSSKLHHDAMLNPVYSMTGFGIKGTKIVEHYCQVK